jgi:prepilin-type N-terminal cleavage/methylation domain-containing protein
MQERRKLGRAFTLIEMMVVILVIMILSGILFRVTRLIQDRMARSRCVYELEQLQNALNEFYSEYERYPPVSFVEYEYEAQATNTQSRYFRELFLPAHNDPEDPDTFFPDQRRDVGTWPCSDHRDWALGYRYGLVSFLYRRARGQVYARGTRGCWYDQDTARDLDAKDSWHHYIDDIGPDGGGYRRHDPPTGMESIQPYSNEVVSLYDPWGRTYRYQCRPPFIRYRLWSAGPDGVDGTDDDVHHGRYSE